MENCLAEIDRDIGQAITSSRVEEDGGRVTVEQAQEAKKELCEALRACKDAVATWNGPFPFESAELSVLSWDPTGQSLGR